jgi:hypothetical protein
VSKVLSAARALAVVFGGSVALDAGALASLRALQRRPRPWWALAGAALTAAYAVFGRRFMARHHDIEIAVPPEVVWPWLAQIGQDRGGFYSIEWLENLAGCAIHNADEIHPEWQHREVGEKLPLHPLNGLAITRFEPDHALGIEGWATFELEPLPGGCTRVVERMAPAGPARRLFGLLLVELPHFVMQQAMFRGLKRRAERSRQPGRLLRSSSSSAAARAAASSAARTLAS